MEVARDTHSSASPLRMTNVKHSGQVPRNENAIYEFRRERCLLIALDQHGEFLRRLDTFVKPT
jgi:hypothetical protein